MSTIWSLCSKLSQTKKSPLLPVWRLWPLKTVMSGKHQKVDSVGQQRQPVKVAPKSKEPTLWHTGEISLITTSTKAYSNLPMVKGLIGKSYWDFLLDTGSSVSLVSENVVVNGKFDRLPMQTVNVKTASCNKLQLSSFVNLPVNIGSLNTTHKVLICKTLVSPVILGTDFMSEYDIEIDFKARHIRAKGHGVIWPESIVNDKYDKPFCCPIHTHQHYWENSYTVAAIIPDSDEIDECAIPLFNRKPTYNLPKCTHECQEIVNEYFDLFSSIAGITETIQHYIPTESASPVQIPPRRIPNQYKQEVQHQIHEMLKQGILLRVPVHGLLHVYMFPKRMVSCESVLTIVS